MADDSHDKTHAPTPHRRQEARDRGHVARSQDLSSAVLLLAAASLLWWQGTGLVNFFGRLTADQLGGEAWLDASPATVVERLQNLGGGLAELMLPLLGLILLVAVAMNVMQVGVRFLPERVMPDVSRIDPLQGLSRLFSLTTFARLGFGVLKLAVVGLVAYFSVVAERATIAGLAEAEPVAIAKLLFELLFFTTLKIGGALAVLAILDYGFQWWKHERDLRMTTQELREEMRTQQGDPQLAMRRKALRQATTSRIEPTRRAA